MENTTRLIGMAHNSFWYYPEDAQPPFVEGIVGDIYYTKKSLYRKVFDGIQVYFADLQGEDTTLIPENLEKVNNARVVKLDIKEFYYWPFDGEPPVTEGSIYGIIVTKTGIFKKVNNGHETYFLDLQKELDAE